MNHISKIHTFAIFGAIMALALMPIMVDSVYADSTDKVTSKIQEIEKRLNIIQEKSDNFKDSEIGKQAFQFRVTGEMISELKETSFQELIKSNSFLKAKVTDLESVFGSTLNEYNNKVTEYERESDVSLDKKNLISQLKKNQIDYQEKIAKIEQQEQTKEMVKSEIARLDAQKQFLKIHRDVYIANDFDRGYYTDETILIALEKVVDQENYSLVTAGLDKMINQYREGEIRQQLQEFKVEILDSMKELEEVKNQETQVLALTSGDIDITTSGAGFGEENEIFNSEIITNQLKEKIKETVQNTKKLANKISQEYESNYQAALKVANANSDSPSVVTPSEPEPEPEPKDKKEKTNENNGNDKNVGNANNENSNNGNGNGKND